MGNEIKVITTPHRLLFKKILFLLIDLRIKITTNKTRSRSYYIYFKIDKWVSIRISNHTSYHDKFKGDFDLVCTDENQIEELFKQVLNSLICKKIK